MPFTIVTKDRKKYSWTSLEKKPLFEYNDPKKQFICVLTAEGRALKQIANRFTNVPYSIGKCVWRGEMAQFIYDNL